MTVFFLKIDRQISIGAHTNKPHASGAYGPRVTNELIREALHPYPASLHVVTKVGAQRDERGGWPRPGGRRTCAARSTRTAKPSASTGSTWSTSGSATHGDRGPARSPRRSAPWPSSSAHLTENVAGAGIRLSDDDLAELDEIGRKPVAAG